MSFVLIPPFDLFAWKCFEGIRVNIGAFRMKAEVVSERIMMGKSNSNNNSSNSSSSEQDDGDEFGLLLVLQAPICADLGDKVGICRLVKEVWTFCGGGIIRRVREMRV